MLPAIPSGWTNALAAATSTPSYLNLQTFLHSERESRTVFPAEADVFSALALTALADVRVVILGQDPYPGPGQAHGLSFSVRAGIPAPKSLVNIFKEAQTDVGCRIPNNGFLVPWAQQGVLMLNTILTVVAHKPNSHKDHGWEQFTDAVIDAVNAKTTRVIFVLWGKQAQKKAARIDTPRHTIVDGAHPSPLSAAKFFGTRPFSRTNSALRAAGLAEIDWQIPDL